MRGAKLVITVAAFGFAQHSSAQSTNCIGMGTGMVHCDTIGTGRSGNLSAIAEIIARSNERSFQKKVGEFLNKGDCAGAAKLAFTKGRLDLGNRISAVCAQRDAAMASQQPLAASRSTPPENGPTASPLTTNNPALENMLRVAAAKANAATPTPLNEITTATKVEAIGTQILITASVNIVGGTTNDAERTSITNQICANPSSPELLKAGASIRIKYYDRNNVDIGSVMVTRSDCGM